MDIVSTQDFLTVAYNWMCRNIAAIEQEWPQKGGWEPWTQGELVRAVNAVYPTAMAQREQHVYVNPRESTDLMLNDPENVASVVLVELKCQSLGNMQNFVSGLTEDVYCLDHALAFPFGMAHRISVGFYFTNHFTLPPGFQWNAQNDPTNSVGMCYLEIS